MRSLVRCLIAMTAVLASVLLAPAGTAAIAPSAGAGIVAVLPRAGDVVGVAHPIVVTFTGPVTDRAATAPT